MRITYADGLVKDYPLGDAVDLHRLRRGGLPMDSPPQAGDLVADFGSDPPPDKSCQEMMAQGLIGTLIPIVRVET